MTLIPQTIAKTVRDIRDEVMSMERTDCRAELANLCGQVEALAHKIETLERLAETLRVQTKDETVRVEFPNQPHVAAVLIHESNDPKNLEP